MAVQKKRGLLTEARTQAKANDTVEATCYNECHVRNTSIPTRPFTVTTERETYITILITHMILYRV